MVVRALGYTDNCNELKGMTWPTNFKVKAAELELLNGVKMAASGADRGGVAQLLYNALDATLVTVTVDGDVTLLQDQVGTNKIDRILLTRLAKAAPEYEVITETLDKDSKYYGGNIVDLAPYMYQTIDAYVSKTNQYKVVYVKDVVSLTIEGTVTESTVGSITVEDANDKEHVIKVETGKTIKTYFNGVENQKTEKELEDAKVTVIINDVNDNEKFDASKDLVDSVVATKATKEVQIKKAYAKGKLKLDSINLPEADDEVDFDNLVIKGDATKLEDIKKDSVVTAFEGKDGSDVLKLTLVVSTDTVEGKVTKTNTAKDVITIAGKAYDMSAFGDTTDIKAGAEGTFFLNADGEIFSFEKEGTGAPKNYAVVTAQANGTYVSGFGVEKEAQVKLATEEGKIVNYKVDEDASIAGGFANGVTFGENLVDVVVEYELTKDGKIDSLVKVIWNETNKEFVPKSKSFVLADDSVMFDGYTKNSKDKYDYEVLSYEQLDEDKIVAHVVFNDNGEIELLLVKDGVNLEETGTYAIITNVELTVNDDDEDVYLFTAWVDGVKKELLTSKKFRAENTTASALKSGYVLQDLTLKDGVVTDMDVKGGTQITVVDVNTNTDRIKSASTWYGLAEDAVIYLQTGSSKVVVEDIYEVDEGDIVTLYNTDKNDDIEIVIIKQRP